MKDRDLNSYWYEKSKMCKRVFKDSHYNVGKLLDIVYHACKEKFIDQKKYKKLITIYKLLCSTNIEAINAVENDKELMPMLYEAFKEIQYKTFTNLKNNCYKFDETDLDVKRTKNGVCVYNIGNKDCNFFLHASRMEKGQLILDEEIHSNLYSHGNEIFKSLSFVNNQNLTLYKDLNDYITFVYPSNIPNDYLITISSGDAYTYYTEGYDITPYSKCKPFFGDFKKLLDKTEYYNEIAILRGPRCNTNNPNILPCAIFCNKKITQQEYKIANKLNIPIIFSESEYTHHETMENFKLYFTEELKDNLRYYQTKFYNEFTN